MEGEDNAKGKKPQFSATYMVEPTTELVSQQGNQAAVPPANLARSGRAVVHLRSRRLPWQRSCYRSRRVAWGGFGFSFIVALSVAAEAA